MANAIHGRDPITGRAFKADGTVRKERRTLSVEEKIAQVRDMERKAFATIGRKIMGAVPSLSGFLSGLGIFKGWIREARSYSDADKRAAKRAYYQRMIDTLDAKGDIANDFLPYYQRMIDTLDAKGDIANDFLPAASKAAEVIDGLYSRIGQGYQDLVKSGNATPENVERLITENLGDDVREIVESANNPDSDPFASFRRDADPEVPAVEDSDNL